MAAKVLGYYIDKEGTLENGEVIVVMTQDVNARLNTLPFYSPREGHGELEAGYLQECTPITRNQYVKASASWHTPKEYIPEAPTPKYDMTIGAIELIKRNTIADNDHAALAAINELIAKLNELEIAK